jgi:hypothetical protein
VRRTDGLRSRAFELVPLASQRHGPLGPRKINFKKDRAATTWVNRPAALAAPRGGHHDEHDDRYDGQQKDALLHARLLATTVPHRRLATRPLSAGAQDKRSKADADTTLQIDVIQVHPLVDGSPPPLAS